MNIKSLIREEVNRALVNETLANFESLHDGISTSTTSGKAWFKLINSLESVVNEVKNFNEQHSSSRHGALPNTSGATIKLESVVETLQSIKPVIIGMDHIEKKDI